MLRTSRQLMRAFMITVFVALACAGLSGQTAAPAAEARDDRAAVAALLDQQVTAWNRGDLDTFMEAYWKSPELVFTSGAEVRRGWQTTYERYRDRYGTKPETMGTLAITDLEVTRLGQDAAWVLGRWHLTRAEGESGGVFTLVLRRLEGTWRIVHDHTSAE